MARSCEENDKKRAGGSSGEMEGGSVFKRTSPPVRPGDPTRAKPKKKVAKGTVNKMARRGKRNRQRGQELERTIANELESIGATAVEKSREYHKGKTWDVACQIKGHYLLIQCKRRKRWNWFADFFRKMKDKDLNVLCIHIDFVGDLVCLTKRDFFKLISGRRVGNEKRKLT